MPRNWGPEHEGCHYSAQMRVYYRRGSGRDQRFSPLGWLCRQCGLLTIDLDVEKAFRPDERLLSIKKVRLGEVVDLLKKQREDMDKHFQPVDRIDKALGLLSIYV